jgi:AraC-like DNA-binding protein
MVLDFSTSAGIGGLVEYMSDFSGAEVKNGKIVLPETLGKGYIKKFDLGGLIQMMVSRCKFDEDITLIRTGTEVGKDTITFSFRNVCYPQSEINTDTSRKKRNIKLLPSVQVTSANMNFEIFIPAETEISNVLITIHTDLLKSLLNGKEANELWQNIIAGNQPYLYEELSSVEIQDVAADIIAANVPEGLSDFYFRLKAEELIYLFFIAFLKRKNVASYPLNNMDVKMIYSIRDKMTSDLTVPPNLSELASLAAMSESKMQRLFKQIFGSSMYSYYQMSRINEAAYLIREQKISVSEAGYRMGFTNLSHFTRIFEKHIGLKPKKYSGSLR